MKKIAIALSILAVFSMTAWSQMEGGRMGGPPVYSQPYSPEQDAYLNELIHISRGGQLYDNWWKATDDTAKPEKNHPLWKEQSTNQRSGYDTYRCKECHGWDYLGKDGAYGKGSHFTGFKGVYEAGQKMSIEELQSVLGKKAVGGNERTGSYLFRRNCAHMCHGMAGVAINFGDAEKPEFVGTIASDNPWEFIHKVRAGQPGTRMPSAIINEWSEKELLDLLSFARTLPKDVSEIGSWSRFRGGMGHRGMMHGDYSPGSGRGFGPSME